MFVISCTKPINRTRWFRYVQMISWRDQKYYNEPKQRITSGRRNKDIRINIKVTLPQRQESRLGSRMIENDQTKARGMELVEAQSRGWYKKEVGEVRVGLRGRRRLWKWAPRGSRLPIVARRQATYCRIATCTGRVVQAIGGGNRAQQLKPQALLSTAQSLVITDTLETSERLQLNF